MDSLSSVSPSLMATPLHRRRTTTVSPLFAPRHRFEPSRTIWKNRAVLQLQQVRCKFNGGGEEREDDNDDVEVDKALRLDGTIPGTSDEFVKQVSSRAYDIRRHLHQSIDSSSYDVLDANPWRDSSKLVYVLTQKENQLCTMKTRMNRSEVENELGMLFSKGQKRGSDNGSQPKQSQSDERFEMVIEDVRDGILVFEDQNDAARYCDLLQGGSQGCEGVAEIEASYIFDLCRNSRALAVLFRRGRTPPEPDSLQLKLRARKQSLED